MVKILCTKTLSNCGTFNHAMQIILSKEYCIIRDVNYIGAGAKSTNSEINLTVLSKVIFRGYEV
jgi:hypothetical protein